MLDVTRLRVLVAVARHGSVTAAARALNYAQPSISHHIARLEAETGARLLQRAGRGVRLTDAGRLLAERAEEIIGRLDAAENELAAHVGLRQGRVRLASFPSALGTIVPAAAARLEAESPGLDLMLAEAEPPEALRMLRAGSRGRGAGVPALPAGRRPGAAGRRRGGRARQAAARRAGAPGHPGVPRVSGGAPAPGDGAAQTPPDLAAYAQRRAGSRAASAAAATCCGSARWPGSPRRSRSPPTTTWRSRRWWRRASASPPCPACACVRRVTPASAPRRCPAPAGTCSR